MLLIAARLDGRGRGEKAPVVGLGGIGLLRKPASERRGGVLIDVCVGSSFRNTKGLYVTRAWLDENGRINVACEHLDAGPDHSPVRRR